ncbi:FliD [Desulforapulum autotrophicum HRM2]|uniref:Flagellar hook-associated protein 2 n=1 Tax=Desulforapulum autotrophicum (strain ATCC 43914 / DSM 3382 / VKM B-1955 / HRM2) TaxID=177437 RepID=C0QA29_DESAH|nr:flagellar filament capping protein FliD [Desulforapulum autotrophicum]ACN16747.1 FliD [Desulforapulum autotrophicum HRM2]
MSSGSISTLGIGSGLDLQGILDDLRAVDQTTITNQETEQTGIKEKVQEFNQLNSTLLSMKSTALDLSLGSNFLNREITASGNAVTATSVSGAKTMSHSMEVTALASHSSWNSEGISEKTDSVAVADGTFSFRMGETGSSVSIEIPAGTTLQGLADLINESDANPGVTASIADTGVGDEPYRLVLTSDNTGEDNRIFIDSQLSGLELTESGGAFHTPPTSDAAVADTMDITGANNEIVFRERLVDGTLGAALTATIPEIEGYAPEDLAAAVETAMEAASLSGGNAIDYTVSFDTIEKKFTIEANGSDLYELNMDWENSSAATDLGFNKETDTYRLHDSNLNARFTVDAIAYQRQSNTAITDVIQGISLNMTETGTSTISATEDLGDVKTAIQELVESLNTLKTEIDSNNTYDSDTQTKGVLFGENAVNRIDDELLTFMGNAITTGSSITNLFDLGLEIDEDGVFSIDETVLDAMLSANAREVQTFFIGDLESETTGFADLLNEKLRAYTGSDGLIPTETDAAQDRIDRITTEIADDTARLDKRYEIMANQFVQLDIFMQQMTAQSDYLTQIFESDTDS